MNKLVNNQFQEVELSLVHLFCNKEMAAVDIGTTGNGPYTEQMLRNSSEVFCFEPHPISAQQMREKYGNSITLRERAVSDYIGEAVLKVPLRDDGKTERHGWSSIYKDFREDAKETVSYKVYTTTIDSESLPPVSLIKIDVEGAEIEVLKGAIDTIKSYRPFVLLEMDENHRSGTLKTNTSFFEQLNYSGHYVEKGVLHPIEEFITSGRKNNMEVGAGNIYNFIFIPQEKNALFADVKKQLAKLRTD